MEFKFSVDKIAGTHNTDASNSKGVRECERV